jgi:hypothetical protein
MATLHDALAWLQETPLAHAIQDSEVLFPALESIHVLALAVLAGTIAHVDLRLLGVAWRGRALTAVTREALPWSWAGFAVALASGALLFASAATRYGDNIAFRIKLALLLLAGLNALVFHALAQPRHPEQGASQPPPASFRVIGGASLLLWAGVIVAGRWIGFTVR